MITSIVLFSILGGIEGLLIPAILFGKGKMSHEVACYVLTICIIMCGLLTYVFPTGAKIAIILGAFIFLVSLVYKYSSEILRFFLEILRNKPKGLVTE